MWRLTEVQGSIYRNFSCLNKSSVNLNKLWLLWLSLFFLTWGTWEDVDLRERWSWIWSCGYAQTVTVAGLLCGRAPGSSMIVPCTPQENPSPQPAVTSQMQPLVAQRAEREMGKLVHIRQYFVGASLGCRVILSLVYQFHHLWTWRMAL